MKILSDLAGYTKTHFSDEERMLEQCDYPLLADHREKHAALNRQLAEFYRNFYTSSQASNKRGDVILQHWLYDHILEQDKAYTLQIARLAAD